MIARSWLFVPADSERKLSRAGEAGADALILDLEDSVVPAAKAAARRQAAAYLAGARAAQVWVRINPEPALALADLAAVVAAGPDGIVLPKAEGPRDVARLSHWLDALEAREGLAGIRIMAIATETAAAPLRLGRYAGAALPRLAALTWGAEDLAAALGASTNRAGDGGWADAYRWARAAMLLAARAAGVAPIETLHADFRDEAGLAAGSRAAAAEGFVGRLAIHPGQVAAINAAFTPGDEAVAHARRVVAAFAAEPGAGVVGLEGRMLDLPHLRQAEAVLARAAGGQGLRPWTPPKGEPFGNP